MPLSLPEPSNRGLRSLRPPKKALRTDVPQGISVDDEPDGHGGVVRCATVFLTGAECCFTCSMCDLWQYTLDEETVVGSIPQQLEQARKVLDARGDCDWIKLYNASNFFDPRSVPSVDLEPIARLCRPFKKVIVENHPRLLMKATVQSEINRFAEMLHGELEVAMGLETTDPAAMSILNKQMSLSDYRESCEWLNARRIGIRSFILLQPPGTTASNAVASCLDTFRFAHENHAGHCSIIPVRSGAGWLRQIQGNGEWEPPQASQLECALQECLQFAAGSSCVVTADVWDWHELRGVCGTCSDVRKERLIRMNLTQRVEEPHAIGACRCIE